MLYCLHTFKKHKENKNNCCEIYSLFTYNTNYFNFLDKFKK